MDKEKMQACLGMKKAVSVIPPHNPSYNVKKCSEGFPFERLYRRACDEHCQLYY